MFTKKKLPENLENGDLTFSATTAAYPNGVAPQGTPYFTDPYAATLHAFVSLTLLDDKLVSVDRGGYLDHGEPVTIKPGLRSMPIFLYSVPFIKDMENGQLEVPCPLSRLLVIPDWKDFINYEEVIDENISTGDQHGPEPGTGNAPVEY